MRFRKVGLKLILLLLVLGTISNPASAQSGSGSTMPGMGTGPPTMGEWYRPPVLVVKIRTPAWARDYVPNSAERKLLAASRDDLQQNAARRKRNDAIFAVVGLLATLVGMVTLGALLVDLALDGAGRSRVVERWSTDIPPPRRCGSAWPDGSKIALRQPVPPLPARTPGAVQPGFAFTLVPCSRARIRARFSTSSSTDRVRFATDFV